jgi:hypothetical protein
VDTYCSRFPCELAPTHVLDCLCTARASVRVRGGYVMVHDCLGVSGGHWGSPFTPVQSHGVLSHLTRIEFIACMRICASNARQCAAQHAVHGQIERSLRLKPETESTQGGYTS